MEVMSSALEGAVLTLFNAVGVCLTHMNTVAVGLGLISAGFDVFGLAKDAAEDKSVLIDAFIMGTDVAVVGWGIHKGAF
jgi:hypothetical protein